ncbi:MAG: hypothetical protein ACRD10_03905, partial [Terriglobia bacterium]
MVKTLIRLGMLCFVFMACGAGSGYSMAPQVAARGESSSSAISTTALEAKIEALEQQVAQAQ